MSNTPSLLPCPFCGGGETQIHVNKGTWNGRGYGEPVSVEVRHWCESELGQPSRMISRAGRDESSAIAAWNRRTPQPAGREPEFDQFLSDVMTAAGLVTHGKQCKQLGERLGAAVMKLRAYGITQRGGSNADT